MISGSFQWAPTSAQAWQSVAVIGDLIRLSSPLLFSRFRQAFWTKPEPSRVKKRFEQLLNLKWTSWFGSEPLQWKQSEDLWRCEVYWHPTAQRHLDLLTLRTLTLSCETFVWFYCLGNWTWKGDDSKMFIYINRNVEIYQIDVTLVIWSEQRDTRLYSCLWLGKRREKKWVIWARSSMFPLMCCERQAVTTLPLLKSSQSDDESHNDTCFIY